MMKIPTLLPPRALLIALLAQVPWLLINWPPALIGLQLAAGAVALGLGIVLNLYANDRLIRSDVEVCPFHATPRLVSSGPYRVTRNPMYLGMALIAAAPALATGLWLNLLSADAFAIWLHCLYVLPEERFLERRFGEPYNAYRRRVARWLGWPAAADGGQA